MSTYSNLIKASLDNTLADEELLQGLIDLVSANPSSKNEILGAIEAPYRTGRLSENLYKKITAAITDYHLRDQTEATHIASTAQSSQSSDETLIQPLAQPRRESKNPAKTPNDNAQNTRYHQDIDAPLATLDTTPTTVIGKQPVKGHKAKHQDLPPNTDETLATPGRQPPVTQMPFKSDETSVTNKTGTTGLNHTQSKPRLSSPPTSTDTTSLSHTFKATAQAKDITATQNTTNELKPGSIIKGRFVLEEILGQGGMGIVYKARDLRKEEAQDRNPYVAIKVLGTSFKDHPHSLIALQREARKAQTLAHPNIVTVYDFDRDGETVYMTMEYLEGDALDKMLKRLKPKPMEKPQALRIIEGICSGLAYAHKHNIIHSDLKPGNIFVTKHGDVKVFDFGIARAIKPKAGTAGDGDTTVFDAGSLGGLTPAYASVEMLQGKDPDVRDDIYALACIAFELLGGQHPYNKQPADQAKEGTINPPLLKNLSRSQYKALLKGLAFERDARTESVKQFSAEISGQRKLNRLTIVALVAAVVIVALVVGPLQQYLNKQKVWDLADALKSGNQSTINATLAQLASTDASLRENVLSEAKDDLIFYYKQLAEQEINAQQNKFDFKQARTILSKAESIFPDSAQLAGIIKTIEDRKNRLLNNLTRTFNSQLATGKFLPEATPSAQQTQPLPAGEPSTILDTLKIVAAIDAEHPLLSDPRLIVEFSAKTKQAANARQFNTAKTLLTAAIDVFPNEPQLIDLQDQIRIQEQNYLLGKLTTIPEQTTANSSNTKLSIADRQKEVERLLNTPFSNSDWSNTLARQLNYLIDNLPTSDPWLQKKRQYIAELYFKHALARRDAKRYTEANTFIQHAHQWDATIPGIKKELASITNAKKMFEQQKQQQARKAKIEGLKQTLLTQAKANDVKGAKISYDALKKRLAANSHYIRETAPNEIGNAYLRLANDLAKRDQYKSAIKLADAGLLVAPDLAPLIDAKKKYSIIDSQQNALKIATENDPCKPSFAGYGKRKKATCSDNIGAQQSGPKLVVIPAGESFPKPFAIGKYEVSVKEFNLYCQLSKSCQQINAPNLAAPITNISAKQADAFINWLSQTTGYKYRLPTLKEWKYAANANGKQPRKDFNCRVVLGGRVVKGNALVDVNAGKKNGWGLVNYIGNAQEWVALSLDNAPLKLIAIGGAYKDPLANCDITFSRNHGGKADIITGFRVLRELI
ncbi:MAG: protein kinase [Gammaproteobacteria bacterium]|nr:protein kinase [Gammaproteobacteria bacterium]